MHEVDGKSCEILIVANGDALFGGILDRFAYPDLRKYDIAIMGKQDRYIQIVPMAKKVSF